MPACFCIALSAAIQLCARKRVNLPERKKLQTKSVLRLGSERSASQVLVILILVPTSEDVSRPNPKTRRRLVEAGDRGRRPEEQRSRFQAQNGASNRPK